MMKLLFLLIIYFFFSFQMNFILIFLILFLELIQFSSNFFNFSHYFFMDLISLVFIILTMFLVYMMMMSQYKYYQNMILLMFFFLIISLFMTFKTCYLLNIYIYFEWSLIPMFLIIMGWGYQPERTMASLFLFFYTLFASLPLLFIIIYIIKFSFNNFMYFLFMKKYILFYNMNLFNMMMFFTFLVKFPMFFVHSWLPKAHVEAPVSGSMLLAGIMLKLGGYGFIRLFMFINKNMFFEWIICLSLMGGSLLSILCLIQSDMKVMIAYSSIVHMSLVIIGLLSLSLWGLNGAMIIMLSHGLVSSGMFSGANMMYERSHSRSFLLNMGYKNFIPFFSMMWFMYMVANFSGPFSYNMLGEILLILNISQMNIMSMTILCFLSFFSAAYSIILYSSTQHGIFSNLSQQMILFNFREMMVQFSHLWPILLLLMSPFLI